MGDLMMCELQQDSTLIVIEDALEMIGRGRVRQSGLSQASGWLMHACRLEALGSDKRLTQHVDRSHMTTRDAVNTRNEVSPFNVIYRAGALSSGD